MDTNSYIAFLVLGAILVAIDGQIIYRSGRKYIEHSYGDSAAGASMTRLVTVLFHLVVLGVLMLISTVDVGSNQTEGVILRLGIVLLLLAAAHAVTIAILARIKDRQLQERLAEEMAHPPGKPQPQTQIQPNVQAIRHEKAPEPSVDQTPPYLTP
jgi:hypothetical protein